MGIPLHLYSSPYLLAGPIDPVEKRNRSFVCAGLLLGSHGLNVLSQVRWL